MSRVVLAVIIGAVFTPLGGITLHTCYKSGVFKPWGGLSTRCDEQPILYWLLMGWSAVGLAGLAVLTIVGTAFVAHALLWGN